MVSPRNGVFVAVAVVAVALSACAAKPRERPLPIGDIASGPNTLEAARKALQGSWVLNSLNVTGPDGRTGAIDAAGSMNFDGFGNMNIEYRMSETGLKTLEGFGIKSPNPVISTTGSVAINPTAREITYTGPDFEKRALGFDPDLAAQRANPFALERKRYYEIGPDGTLTLMTRYDDGSTASIGRWKKGA